MGDLFFLMQKKKLAELIRRQYDVSIQNLNSNHKGAFFLHMYYSLANGILDYTH